MTVITYNRPGRPRASGIRITCQAWGTKPLTEQSVADQGTNVHAELRPLQPTQRNFFSGVARQAACGFDNAPGLCLAPAWAAQVRNGPGVGYLGSATVCAQAFPLAATCSRREAVPARPGRPSGWETGLLRPVRQVSASPHAFRGALRPFGIILRAADLPGGEGARSSFSVLRNFTPSPPACPPFPG